MSQPFLSAPYAGYAEVATFFDHDLPDYAVDGKIVTTTGLTATGAPAAGVFPSYWSPQVRQYINYDGHNGYDYDIIYQPVLAAAKGVVTYAGWESTDPYFGYGQMVVIQHASGYMTLYGHLSKIDVGVGQKVRAGQRIGISGTTGHSTGPHLHFTVYHNCHAIDPYGWNGKGPDPLIDFNGETSTYLWKLGKAPGILNPLPNWPTYSSVSTIPPFTFPPLTFHPRIPEFPDLNHLLLLRIPTVRRAAPDVAVSLFQQQVGDEIHQIKPLLRELVREGAIESFRAVPRAGAIRVRGSMPAQQLSGLPGVASVVGDRPKDVEKASQGLMQALARGLRRPSEATLFPSSFLEQAWTWQLHVAVQEGGSLVLGFTQPNSRVRVEIYRGHKLLASGSARGESTRGAFAVTMRDTNGNVFRIGRDESVAVWSAGKSTSVQMVPLSVTAGHTRLVGSAPPGARVETSIAESLTGRAVARSESARRIARSATGAFSVHMSGRIAPGDPLSASVTEASGNTIFATNRAGGFQATAGSSSMQGWVRPGQAVRVDVFGQKRWHAAAEATAGPDGFVHMALRGLKHHPYAPAAGNHIRVEQKGGATTWFPVPHISGTLGPKKLAFKGRAPKRAHIFLRVWNDPLSAPQVVSAKATRTGLYKATLPQKGGPGLSVDVLYPTASGSLIRSMWAARSLIIHERSGLVEGHAGPGETLFLHSRVNSLHLGAALAQTGTTNGSFTTDLERSDGVPIGVPRGGVVELTDGQVNTSYVAPGLFARCVGGNLKGWTSATGRIQVILRIEGRSSRRFLVRPSRPGNFHLLLPPIVQVRQAHLELLVDAGPDTALALQSSPPTMSALAASDIGKTLDTFVVRFHPGS